MEDSDLESDTMGWAGELKAELNEKERRNRAMTTATFGLSTTCYLLHVDFVDITTRPKTRLSMIDRFNKVKASRYNSALCAVLTMATVLL
jgi:hypothetical protein